MDSTLVQARPWTRLSSWLSTEPPAEGQFTEGGLSIPVVPAKPTMTFKDVAAYLGVSLSRVYQLDTARRLPEPIRIDPSRRGWRQSDINDGQIGSGGAATAGG